MPIAQMNWGRMKYPADDPRLRDFLDSLAEVYGFAERHPGFIWRIADGAIAAELKAHGFDDRMSATVSVWKSVDDLSDYTFNSMHGRYLDRRSEWFETVDGPQLIIWDVEDDDRPTFAEAWARLTALRRQGPSDRGRGWPS